MVGARFAPVDVTVVASPWNFPVAIPTGGVAAARAAGSAVILKPAPPARRCAAELVRAFHDAGIPEDLVVLAPLEDGEVSRHLVTHKDVDRVVLTGSYDTARLFRSWKPDMHLLGETSGKNAIIVTPSADPDIAVRDAVYSAFAHAGQKCSASSLLVLVSSAGNSERIARQLGLPVCIHDREAHGDLLAILKTEGRENTGVIHCFSGSWETARELLRLGWDLGIDGPVTYKNAAKLPDIVRRLPIDRILLETDSPYLAPVPHRGKRNEPAFVQSTAEFVANLRGILLATLAEQTTANARRLYTLPEA